MSRAALSLLIAAGLWMVHLGVSAQITTVVCPEAVEVTISEGGSTAVNTCVPWTPTATPVPTSTSTPIPTATTAPSPTPTLPAGPIVPDHYTTINAAIAAASPGESVWVRPGRYLEQVSITKDGIRLESLGGLAVIDGECNRTHNVFIKAHDVTIRGVGAVGALQSAIKLDGQSGLQPARALIEGNVISDFNCTNQMRQDYAGISAYYSGSGHRIIGNQVTYRVEIAGPLRGYGSGIYFQSSTSRPSGGGHTISGNVVIGGYDGIGGGVEDDNRGSFDKDSSITFNQVSQCWDDGVQVEGGNQNVTVADNTISECAIGVAFAPDRIGPLHVLRNTIGSSTPGIYGTLACFKVGDGGSGTAYVTANVCNVNGGTATGDGFKQTNSLNSSYVLRDNRMNVSRYVIELSQAPGPGSSFDRDCLYTSDASRFVKWANVNYATLSAFRAATGQEMNGSVGPC